MTVYSMRDFHKPWGHSVWTRLLVFTATALLCFHGGVQAGFVATVSVNVRTLGNGLDEYDYMVSNSSQSTISGYAFALTIDKDADLQSIANPANWSADYTVGSTTITWSTGTAPLTPGNSAFFSFDSAESPSSTAYQVTGFDPSSILFYTSTDTTLAPGISSAVPEPNGLLLAGFGALGVLTILALKQN
jgi:hypothetical protein